MGMMVDVDARMVADGAAMRALVAAGHAALEAGAYARADMIAHELWGMRDDAGISLRDRGLAGHEATTIWRAMRVAMMREDSGARVA